MDIDIDVVEDALDYLEKEGLIKSVAWGVYELTFRGVKEIEESRDHPERETRHFPRIQVINNFGGNQVVAQGENLHVNQLSMVAAPAEVEELVTQLQAADGGTLSVESQELLRVVTESGSKLKIAAAAEDVASKSEEHASLLSAYKEALIKRIAEKSVDGITHGVGWLSEHGPKIAAALALLHHH